MGVAQPLPAAEPQTHAWQIRLKGCYLFYFILHKTCLVRSVWPEDRGLADHRAGSQWAGQSPPGAGGSISPSLMSREASTTRPGEKSGQLP